MTAPRSHGFTFALEPGAHAPADARRELQERLPGGLPAELVDDVLLLTTELVTNSVRHSPAAAAGSVDVAISLAPDRLRVEVSDPGTGFAHVPQHPGTLSEGGRGLFLVDALAERWGIGDGDRTTVWYELDVGSEEQDVAIETDGLVEELRALGSETRSLEDRARGIEADLDRVARSLQRGAEALQAREKVVEPGHPPPDPGRG